MPFLQLINFVLLYLCSKMVVYKLPFFIGALVYAIASTLFAELLSSTTGQYVQSINFNFTTATILFIIALPVFYFLDKYEDNVFPWLVTLGIGFIALNYAPRLIGIDA